ncbi:DUF4105 domain-containing protein [Colwellia sp. BRX10-3]|uniref:Lnb N-terminal periplasmic domain-containing protein n=1 Tax=Colwellia sp. BRX10-3 TaxID=2759844 RepID=UPI0015F40543|nr:DUF4105 domain-containing protein [Colwellia sp. BRX10-3]MBA6390096.1 DUF4105 domain-containing protein [Colwellia sp. BRX10-3]
MQLRLLLLVVTSFLYIFKSYAHVIEDIPYSNELITAVSKSIKWQKLIKLKQSPVSQNGTFAIHSQRFYFSEISTLTAKEELINTLGAFMSTERVSNIAENPQCRFPARYHWLKKQFDLSTVKAVICQDFLDWSKLSSTQSLSLIFATGYLGNPASYYGHTLLKLNSSNTEKLNLLETSVNFGAKVPENEDPITYMLKGVVGGYDASFSHSNFYYHTQNYLENELRDLWEYQLNLSQDDYYFLVAHIWELIEQDYIYYFFDENCVYRMYELFTLFEDINLPSIKAPWVIPQEVVRAINSATYKNGPLVRKIKYIPSRQSNFYNKYWQLKSNEKVFIEKIVANTGQLSLLDSENLTIAVKLRVLSTLLDYYQYLIAVDKDNTKHNKRSYTQILAYRYKLAIGKASFVYKEAKSPHLARPSSYSQISFIHNRKLGNGMTLKLRPAYYDQLDAESGHVRNGALKMAELDLEYIASKLAIRSLSIFEVVSVSNQATGLPYDGYDSWKLYLGLQKQDNECTSCANFIFKANKGLSFPLLENTTLGGYLGGAIVENYLDRGRVYISSNLTLNQSINEDWNFFIDLEARKYLENKQVTKFNFKAEARYRFRFNDEHLDFRLALTDNETMLSLGYYW